jgi:hypothetical protein
MLELFSRVPDELKLGDGAKLTPIPVSEGVSSLSAILLDDAYYEFLHQHRQVLDGITLVSEKCLIPLKAKAWLDLSARKGEPVELSDTVQADMEEFLSRVEPEISADMLKNLGIRGVSPKDVFLQIRRTYGI